MSIIRGANPLLLTALFLVASSAYAQDVSEWTCVTFDDRPGQQYRFGDVDNLSGVPVKFVGFVWGYTSAYVPDTTRGFAEVDHAGRWGDHIGGSGLDIMTNNINIELQMPPETRHVTVRYGDWGGNVNLGINDEFRSYYSFSEIEQTDPFDHVDMRVSRLGESRSYHSGVLEFKGDSIKTLKIGGQELILDDICRAKSDAERIEDALRRLDDLIERELLSQEDADPVRKVLIQRLQQLRDK